MTCCAWNGTSVTLKLTHLWANMNKILNWPARFHKILNLPARFHKILNWPARFHKSAQYEISTKCNETSKDGIQRGRLCNHQYHQKFKWSTGAMQRSLLPSYTEHLLTAATLSVSNTRATRE